MSGEKRDETALREEIAALIKKHCKGRVSTVEDYRNDAADIVLANRWAVKRQRAWRADKELARIDGIERALDQVVAGINDLPEYLRLVLLFGAEQTDAFPKGIRVALEEIRRVAASGFEQAKREAGRGTGYRADIKAGAVLRACRLAWVRRDTRPVPRTAHQNVLGPFPEFLRDVFDVLEIDVSVRSTLAAVNDWQDRLSQ